MDIKQKIWFLMNPKSGTLTERKKTALMQAIQEIIKQKKDIWVELKLTEYAGHATILTQKAVEEGVHIVVAIGGDGTVNEVAQALINQSTALGIIPIGSGNGLARHLKIPLKTHKAVERIFSSNIITIDACYLNQKPFFCTSGVGFDAYVAHQFAKQSKRGLKTYIKTTLTSYKTFRPESYQLIIDGKMIEQEAFAITFANASQYGNNAYIVPHALIDDGWMDVCILKPFPLLAAPSIGIRLFNMTLPNSKYVEIYRAKKIQLMGKSPLTLHFDGEPLTVESSTLHINIQPSALRVVV
jgi:diacylglycerol kinase (ATP)